MKRFDHLTTRERRQSLQHVIELAPDPGNDFLVRVWVIDLAALF